MSVRCHRGVPLGPPSTKEKNVDLHFRVIYIDLLQSQMSRSRSDSAALCT